MVWWKPTYRTVQGLSYCCFCIMQHLQESLLHNFRLLIQLLNSVLRILMHPLKCCARSLAKIYFGTSSNNVAEVAPWLAATLLSSECFWIKTHPNLCPGCTAAEITFCIWTFFCMQSPKYDSHNGTYAWKVTVNRAGITPHCKYKVVIFMYLLRPLGIPTYSSFLCKNLKSNIFF